MKYRLKAASGELTGQAFELGEVTSIGSAADADIRVPELEPQHARIIARDGGLVLEPDAETLLNGESCGVASLNSGDEIRLNNLRMVLQAPGLKPVRVLDRVPERGSSGWKWLAAAGLTAAAAAAGWWLWLGYGVGA